MRTIEEIKSDFEYILNSIGIFGYDEVQAKLIDKLIETVAALQREKCAEEVVLLKESWLDDGSLVGQFLGIENSKNKFEFFGEGGDSHTVTIDKNSILNAKL